MNWINFLCTDVDLSIKYAKQFAGVCLTVSLAEIYGQLRNSLHPTLLKYVAITD